MVWNEALHPRIHGKFATKNQDGSLSYTDAAGLVHQFIDQNQGSLNYASTLLGYMATGKEFTPKTGAPETRVHITATDNGESAAFTASRNGTFINIDHDTPGVDVPFTYCRGNREQPRANSIPTNESAMGGRGVPVADRKDGEHYQTANITQAVDQCEKVFQDDRNNSHDVLPVDVISAVHEARDKAKTEYGYTAAQARSMRIRLSFNKTGQPVVQVYDHHRQGKNGRPEHCAKHGKGCVLRADQLVKACDGLQKSLPDTRVEMIIAHGLNGAHAKNGLYFKHDTEAPDNSRSSSTLYGCVENMKGQSHAANVKWTPGKDTGRTPESRQAYNEHRRAIHAIAAARHANNAGVPKGLERYPHHQYANGDWGIRLRNGDEQVLDKQGIPKAVIHQGKIYKGVTAIGREQIPMTHGQSDRFEPAAQRLHEQETRARLKYADTNAVQHAKAMLRRLLDPMRRGKRK